MAVATLTRSPGPEPVPIAEEDGPGGVARATSRTVTTLIVVGPAVALGAAMPLLWGRGIHLRDVLLAAVFYLMTAFGVTVGFHRLFTHRSFRANRPLKLVLAALGSMAVQGSLIGWVANHRRHHMFSDHAGDPHSPHAFGSGFKARVRGLLHAHHGWLFKPDTTPSARFAPDLLKDRDIVVMSRLFPALAILSLAAPFAIGWAWSGTIAGAFSALLWAGLLRMAALHHVTWSVNSICHVFGKRPFKSNDRSTNFAPLALMSLGESWHNYHHAHPSSARHGALRHQVDISAALIRLFERAGWATKVRWPAPSTRPTAVAA
jgi:stearoyl-CoA desaturase (Delta-9 desaturase)